LPVLQAGKAISMAKKNKQNLKNLKFIGVKYTQPLGMGIEFLPLATN